MLSNLTTFAIMLSFLDEDSFCLPWYLYCLYSIVKPPVRDHFLHICMFLCNVTWSESDICIIRYLNVCNYYLGVFCSTVQCNIEVAFFSFLMHTVNTSQVFCVLRRGGTFQNFRGTFVSVSSTRFEFESS